MAITKTPKEIADFIEKNKHNFTAGARFDEKLITKFFGIAKPSRKGDHSKVMASIGKYVYARGLAQSAVNRVLAASGLYMKQYKYTMYRILDKNETTTQIEQTKSAAVRRISSASRLEATCLSQKKAKWKKPNKSYYNLLTSLGY